MKPLILLICVENLDLIVDKDTVDTDHHLPRLEKTRGGALV